MTTQNSYLGPLVILVECIKLAEAAMATGTYEHDQHVKAALMTAWSTIKAVVAGMQREA